MRIVIISVMPLICHTHTLGSNSTATLGPSVVELIVFAALSWTVIVFIVIFTAMVRYLIAGKQSIKDHNLEFYSQATWEDWLTQKVRRRVWDHAPPPPPPPPKKIFLKMRCLGIVSEAVYKSKMPPVLPVAFGKQNS